MQQLPDTAHVLPFPKALPVYCGGYEIADSHRAIRDGDSVYHYGTASNKPIT